MKDRKIHGESNVWIAFQSRKRIGIGRSYCRGHYTGRHEKSPVHCPCSRLAALHGAQRTLYSCITLLLSLNFLHFEQTH